MNSSSRCRRYTTYVYKLREFVRLLAAAVFGGSGAKNERAACSATLLLLLFLEILHHVWQDLLESWCARGRGLAPTLCLFKILDLPVDVLALLDLGAVVFGEADELGGLAAHLRCQSVAARL